MPDKECPHCGETFFHPGTDSRIYETVRCSWCDGEYSENNSKSDGDD